MTAMTREPLDEYREASEWTQSKIDGATDKLASPTPCDEWDVRALMNHMVQTQRYFTERARGGEPANLSPEPPDLIGDEPVEAYRRARRDSFETFSQDGVAEKTGPMLGIMLSDTLLHGWDLARATGQDTTMPDGLAQSAYDAIHGRFTDEQRTGVFKPEILLGPHATPQERLLAYTGRDPAA